MDSVNFFDADKLAEMMKHEDIRERAIKDCVVWLAQNCRAYGPEYLAGELANDMLSKGA